MSMSSAVVWFADIRLSGPLPLPWVFFAFVARVDRNYVREAVHTPEILIQQHEQMIFPATGGVPMTLWLQ